MNITNATVLFRSDTAANFTSANTTLGNATYNAPEAAYEQDTNRIKIGVGNWTTVPYLPNLTQITNLETNVTTLQGNVTTINASLANKSETSHTHNATTDLTSGTVPTARLGSGTASSSTYLRGDQTWATVAGGAGADNTFIFDVRDYGAAVGTANAAANTAAFQAAVDAAAVQSGGWGSGTVYIPASQNEDNAMWDLKTPVWVWGNGIRVLGEGSKATFLRAGTGPAFVLAKHPRFWSVKNTTYLDKDNANASVNTTSATTGTQFNTIWDNMSRYKPDLYEFRTGGTWPPLNGTPEFAPATITATGQYFGIRSRTGVAQGTYPYCPIATGDDKQTGNNGNSWPVHDKITWEFVVYHHENYLVGSIGGSGTVSDVGSGPDPWMLYGAGTDYHFELALTDKETVDRSWARWSFPQPGTTGLHRITVQFDPDNADATKRIVTWVDRVRVTATFGDYAFILGGQYHPLNGELWTKWNRVARWQESHFGICAENVKTGYYNSIQRPYLTDYTVLAVGVHTELLYAVGAVGSAQYKADGTTPADDSTVWAFTSGNKARTKTLGWVANSFADSPNANADLAVNLSAYGNDWRDCWGFLNPKGDWNNWGYYEATKDNAFEGFSIRQKSGFNTSCGLLLGPFLDQFEIIDLNPAQAGFYASIGAFWSYVSYYARMRGLKLNRMMHLVHMTTDAERIDFGYIPNCAIRLAGSEFRLRSFSFPHFEANTEGFLIATHGGGIGAGIRLADGTINNEGVHFGPTVAALYATKNYAQANNKILIDNVQFGEFGGRTIYLDDLNPQDPRETAVRIENTGLSTAMPMIIVRGKDWHGEVEINPDAYTTTTVEYLDAVSGTQNFCDIKTIDKAGYGVPPCGGFVSNAHEVHVRTPAEGGVSKWRASYSANAVKYEGTNDPPTWIPAEFNGSNRYQHAISANIMPGIHATCSLPWPDGANPTTILFSGMTLPFQRLALATILAGGTAPTRTHMRLRWGVNGVYHVSNGVDPEPFFASASTANSGTWAAAANGQKATSAAITANGTAVPPWTVRIRRRWTGSIAIGASGTETAAFVFKTNVREPAHWVIGTGDTPQVASGGLILKRTTRPGGNLTYYAANQILDWITGGSLSLASTWYFGLSTTSIDLTAGTGMTEPGAGYARKSVTMSSANWSEYYDSGFYGNKTAIQFAAPSGGDWGRITHWFISDASTGGNIIACGPLNRPILVRDGDTGPVFLPGAFQVQL